MYPPIYTYTYIAKTFAKIQSQHKLDISRLLQDDQSSVSFFKNQGANQLHKRLKIELWNSKRESAKRRLRWPTNKKLLQFQMSMVAKNISWIWILIRLISWYCPRLEGLLVGCCPRLEGLLVRCCPHLEGLLVRYCPRLRILLITAAASLFSSSGLSPQYRPGSAV